MSGDFECFVTIGDKKQSIYLDKDIDGVIFSDVYKQLTQLDVNPVVSFDNYIFEVFDFEDNCFQRLTSVEMPIKYLSRIRVLPKNSNNDSNYQTFNDKPKGFKPKFNNNLFNRHLINQNQVNEDFFNVEAHDDHKPLLKPKRPIGPTHNWHNYKKPLYSEPNPSPEDQEEYEMNEEFYNKDLYFNTNKRKKYRGYGDYGADDFEYDYSGPSAPSPKPYVRRSDMMEPVAGPSFANPYVAPPPQQYYCRRDDFYNQYMGPPQEGYSEFVPYYHPNEPQFNFRPDFPQNMRFRPDFNQGMGFRPNFEQNFPSNQWFPKRMNRPMGGYPKRREQNGENRTNKKQNTTPRALSPKTRNDLRNNGFTVETINGFDYYFCEFCEMKVRPINNAFNHMRTEKHQIRSSEKNLDPLDKLLLVKTQNKGPDITICRRQELRKMSKLDKQKMVRHGIRLKDGSGPQAYICIRCCSSMSSLSDCHKHHEKFIEINNTINYPKDYHLLNEDNSLPKVELRYKRILNALELLIEENRSEETTEKLMELRDEGIVLKESIDGVNHRYHSCLVCDKRFDNIEDAITHSKDEEHLRNRSVKRYRGLDRALLMDSERSEQIEVVLARKQELEKIRFFTKELNLEHGIRLKDGIGPEAYFCTKCDQWFDSSNMVKIHVDEYDKRVINESTEEFLIDSAKKQMELLTKAEKPEVIAEEVEPNEEKMDFTADEDNSSLNVENFEKRFEDEGIKSLDTNEENEDKYYDMFCEIHFKDKEQALHHLNRSFHKKVMSEEFLSSVDKAFCVSSNRMNEVEVVLSRLQVLERLADEVKEKFGEEGIRLRDGIGGDAFWCLLCNDSILSPNVESGFYSFINHINYNPKHVELLIGQNK